MAGSGTLLEVKYFNVNIIDAAANTTKIVQAIPSNLGIFGSNVKVIVQEFIEYETCHDLTLREENVLYAGVLLCTT